MKKTIFAFSLSLLLISTYSCKSKPKEESQDTTAETTQQPATQETTTSTVSQPKTYNYSALPDTVLLGKKSEALVKIKEFKAIELSDPEGKSTGLEVSYLIDVTNKNAIGGNEIYFPTNDFRLELDNGQKIAPNGTSENIKTDETKSFNEDKFEVPAGAKPVALSLFYDGTKANVKLEQK